jgi:hypothetical protein
MTRCLPWPPQSPGRPSRRRSGGTKQGGVLQAVEDNGDQGPDVLDTGDPSMEVADDGDLVCVVDIEEDGRVQCSHEYGPSLKGIGPTRHAKYNLLIVTNKNRSHQIHNVMQMLKDALYH